MQGAPAEAARIPVAVGNPLGNIPRPYATSRAHHPPFRRCSAFLVPPLEYSRVSHHQLRWVRFELIPDSLLPQQSDDANRVRPLKRKTLLPCPILSTARMRAAIWHSSA